MAPVGCVIRVVLTSPVTVAVPERQSAAGLFGGSRMCVVVETASMWAFRSSVACAVWMTATFVLASGARDAGVILWSLPAGCRQRGFLAQRCRLVVAAGALEPKAV